MKHCFWCDRIVFWGKKQRSQNESGEVREVYLCRRCASKVYLRPAPATSAVETRRGSGRAEVTAPGLQRRGADKQVAPRPDQKAVEAPAAPQPAAVTGQATGGPFVIGQRVAGVYEVRGVLGRGGMGIVYLGHNHATQRPVAIKVPLGTFVDDSDARKRFVREAEAWTELVYPHIVHAFDVRDDQSTNYRPVIVMDYCAGGSLAERISGGKRLAMADALDIAIQVCWAMEFAHGNGHVHRDLKPSNMLLDGDGRALVTDFGLVKSLKAEDVGLPPGRLRVEQAELLATVSRGGGTPEYMPPEQWEGRAEKQSDVYSFGVMLYELLCGRLPFRSENRLALRVPHEKAPPPSPRQWNGQIPEDLAALMVSCLAKSPKDRPGDFAHVVEGLSKAYQEVVGHNYTLHRQKPTGRAVSRSDQEAHAGALLRLGIGCRRRGNVDDAMRQHLQAEAIFHELGDNNGLATSLGNQASILYVRGNLDAAMELLKQQEQICRELGNKDGLATSLGNQASILHARGDLDGAMAEEAFSLASDAGLVALTQQIKQIQRIVGGISSKAR